MTLPLRKGTPMLWHMDDGQRRTGLHPRLAGDTRLLYGDCSHIRGSVAAIWGDVSCLKGDTSRLAGDVTGLHGDCSGIHGLCSKLTGDCTHLRGEVTNLCGDCSRLSGDASGLQGECTLFAGDLDLIPMQERRRRNLIVHWAIDDEAVAPLHPRPAAMPLPSPGRAPPPVDLPLFAGLNDESPAA